MENFSLAKLNVFIPRGVEAVWGLMKSNNVPGPTFAIIVCCFYSPPDRGKNSPLLDHITMTLLQLLQIHKNPGVLICGDRNQMPISSILTINPSLQQIVNKPTHGTNILDVVYTNLSSFFQQPIILPELCPDDPQTAVASDHLGGQLIPIVNNTHTNKRERKIRIIQPLPESLIDTLKLKLSSIDFSVYLENLPVDEMVSSFEIISKELMDDTFPTKKVCVYASDQPWFNEELRLLKRQRSREYVKHGKSSKYHSLLETFNLKAREAIEKYKQKVRDDVIDGRRGSTYPAFRKLGSKPRDSQKNEFHLPSHAGFSPNQSAECIAAHFSKISQEYDPLSLSSLPPNVRKYIADEQSLMPGFSLTIADVKKRLVKAKKPLGIVPGDLPRKIVTSCVDQIAVPATMIFNEIIRSAKYPSKWKIEHQVPIPKVHPPETENDLRNIAKTSFLSKVFESFIAEWLLAAIKPYLDPNQCGLKGSSITHYLIKFLHFIHSSLDMRKPQAVLAAYFDLSKAYNRVDHSLVIQDLYDMKTPAWLLKIIFSYLSDRTMMLTFRGAVSSSQALPAGIPQGAYLGGLIFIIKFNGAFLRPNIPRNSLLHSSKSEEVKYIDDGSVAVSVDLRKVLVPDSTIRPRPWSFHERTGHALPPENNLLQKYVRDAEIFTRENKMLLNKKKTDAMIFTFSRKMDFPPEISFLDGTLLATVEEKMLLGVIISSDLKWAKNTAFICTKARQKLWILKRMLSFNFTYQDLFDVYQKEVRSILEYAAPVWHSGLTRKQTSEIEAVQKLAFKIILGPLYSTYQSACTQFGTVSLEQRRLNICMKFVSKNIQSEQSFFEPAYSNHNLRPRNVKVREIKCNTARFQRSSIPFLGKLANTRN